MIDALNWMQKYNFVSIKTNEREEWLKGLDTLEDFYKVYEKVSLKERKQILNKIEQIKEILNK